MKKTIQKAWKNVFFKGGVFITGSSFIINFLNYLFNSIVGRSLGPTGLSEIAALFSYIAVFSIPATVVSMIVIQRISSAKTPAVYARSVERYFLRRAYKYWLLIALCFLAVPFIPRLTNLTIESALALIPIIVLTLYFGLYQAIMQGLKLFTAFAGIGLILTTIKLSGAVSTLVFPVGYTVILACFVLSLAVGAFLSRRAVVKTYLFDHSNKVWELPYRVGSILKNRQFIVTVISIIAVTLFNNIDIIFVKKFLQSTESGWYNSWALFARIVFYVVGPLISLSYVYFAQGEKRARQDSVLLYSLVFLSIFGALMYIVYSQFAPFVIQVVFGNKFLAVSPFLGKAAIFGILYSTIMYLNNYFLARRSRYALILPAALPLYVAALSYATPNVSSYITVVLYNSFAVTALCVLAALHTMIADSKAKL